MAVPEIKPASFKPAVISELEFSDYTRTLQYRCFCDIYSNFFFCMIASYKSAVKDSLYFLI
jgi:hypothetical protein